MNAATQQPHALAECDYEPVRSLIEEARRRRNIANAIVTWQNAFMLFNQTEKRIGLPGDEDRDSYLAIVSDLRAAGYNLLCLADANDINLEKEADISRDAMRSCIAELEFNDRAEFLAKDTAAMAAMARFFGEK